MHSGESLALAGATAVVELELIRARMRVTVSMLDRMIAERRHLRAVPDRSATIAQLSAGRAVLLLQDLRDQPEGIGE